MCVLLIFPVCSTCCTHLTLLDMANLKTFGKDTNYEAPDCGIFSFMLVFMPCYLHICLAAPWSQTFLV